jgi:hypothetical protein
MSYHALAKFKCDGCKVVESKGIEVPSDNLRRVQPPHWLRVEACKLRGDLDVIEIRHFCPSCAPMVESYLNGAAVAAEGHA